MNDYVVLLFSIIFTVVVPNIIAHFGVQVTASVLPYQIPNIISSWDVFFGLISFSLFGYEVPTIVSLFYAILIAFDIYVITKLIRGI